MSCAGWNIRRTLIIRRLCSCFPENCRPYRQPQNYRTSPPTLTRVGWGLCNAWHNLAESERLVDGMQDTDKSSARSRRQTSERFSQRPKGASSCSVSSTYLCSSDPHKEEGQLAGKASRGFNHLTGTHLFFTSRIFWDFAAAVVHQAVVTAFICWKHWRPHFLFEIHSRLLRRWMECKNRKSWDSSPVKGLWLVRTRSVFLVPGAWQRANPSTGLLSSAKGICPSKFP